MCLWTYSTKRRLDQEALEMEKHDRRSGNFNGYANVNNHMFPVKVAS